MHVHVIHIPYVIYLLQCEVHIPAMLVGVTPDLLQYMIFKSAEVFRYST